MKYWFVGLSYYREVQSWSCRANDNYVGIKLLRYAQVQRGGEDAVMKDMTDVRDAKRDRTQILENGGRSETPVNGAPFMRGLHGIVKSLSGILHSSVIGSV